MPTHRIAKRAGTLLASAGASPQTIGLVFDNTNAEAILKASSDGVNIRKIDDGHMGAAAETANMTHVGIASQQQVAAGNGNAADTTDDVLFTYQLPANALSAAGKAVEIFAWGKTGATGNNKQVKLWWGTTTQTVGLAVAGGTAILASGVITSNALAWSICAQVVKTASNVQISWTYFSVGANATSVQTATTNLSATDTAAINITLTGASGTTGAAGDVLAMSMTVDFAN